MNAVNIIDPQVFMKCLPVSVPSHKGVKIKARSATVYNASIPTRDEVRRENFKRRQIQMSCQGFKSPIYLPYRGIGEPILLDDKSLILAAGGYRPEDLSCEKSLHLVDDKHGGESKADKTTEIKPMTSGKRVLLRSNRKLNTLNEAVVQGRILIRNVRLGRGYFQILKEQEKEKKKSLEQKERERVARARFQWRNPKYENSDSESDPECEEERSNLLIGSANPEMASLSVSSRQNRRKKSATVRPYTPLHTNMAHCSEDINGDALFRQLCVLLWLLEATYADSIHNMIPIHSCWKLQEICNPRSNYKKNLKPRWDSFTNNSGTQMVNKSFNRSKQHGGLTRRSSSQRSSFTPGMSTCTTPDQSSLAGQQDGSVPEESLDLSDGDDSQQYSLGNYSTDVIGDPGKLRSSRVAMESSRFSKEAWKSKGHEKAGQRKPKQVRQISCSNEQLTQEQLPKSKFHLRPKSSPAFFQRDSMQSVDESLIKQLQEKFEEVKEEKALTLHESLERMEKECLLVCESKFRAMSIDYPCYRQALAEMRNGTSKLLSESKKKLQNDGKNWFSQLELSIPSSLKNIWYYQVILPKLYKFGLLQNFGNKFVKFLKVLSGLQPWQICSPDISAAIEFFRARIIQMSVEEYERWFHQQFPLVYRPETAPTKSSEENRNKRISNKRTAF